VSPSPHIFVVRLKDGLRDPGDRAVHGVLEQFGITELPDPRWRRHAQNLLTVRIADADPQPGLAEHVATHPAVDRVIDLGGSRLYSHWPSGQPNSQLSSQPNPIRLRNGATFGGAEPVVIAGPCSVEGSQQVEEIAAVVAAAGARALRGGVFKPRTSPYDFGGLGEDGLLMMAQAGKRSGLPIVTEVLDPTCMDLVAEHADVLQIGSRNMHNTPFLFALGAHPRGKPALLKRGFGATVEELLSAAEYFLLGRIAAGHKDPGLILCERGVRTFETSSRFTLDLAAIPVLRERTHLPLIVDPSHPAGNRGLVPSLAAAAIAGGAHGLLVEVHTDPRRAWCDGGQSVDPQTFREIMKKLTTLRSPTVAPPSDIAPPARDVSTIG
jgi:3-deoxy-7-phosphoheptulonate synthase